MEKSSLLVGGDPSKINFISAISHEMRNPLSAVIGFAEVLYQQDEELEAEARKDLAAAILRNGELLLRLVDDILDLSRIEGQHVKLEHKALSLDGFLQDIHSDLKTQAADKGVDLILDLPSQKFHVMVDPLRLKQMLLNVVGNALKFTNTGWVRIEVQMADHAREARQIIFRVHDTGVGIHPDGIPKLFIPFSQADSSIAKNYGGTGLGLVISRNLARMMGGDIKLISSEVGVGSVFEVSIVTNLVSNGAEPAGSSLNL